ncbi:MAG: selenocysteine-specific translation elongation factor [Actinobacteria bacterium]|nr:selenocysteine-specific translation elongation factor [Actinomycetota bacterium]
MQSGSATAGGRPPLALGTAGHIDHGKTALVTRLTGKHTDRLREEKERGISIELGYAELELPSGARLSVVDVPGHERFVRTMVAGATGVDLFLLVVAADDGVMPQTVEHLAIIELLGVRDGVVALTKADLVDEELLDLAAEDVRAFLDGTPFAACEVVTVSAKDGRGLTDLVAALDRVAGRVEAGRRDGPARLPVDRVFPLKGIGTVVTGTLWTGEIAAGDALVVEPGGARAAVRSVQVHDRETERVRAGSRVGVNLRGLDRDDVRRGDWLVAPQLAGLATRRFDAWVSVLPGGRPLRSGDRVRLHHGTAQYLARVAPLEGREIAPGAAAAAVVRLEGPALVLPHDRFIIRSLSPVATIAGGEVLLAGAQRWHARERHGAFLSAVRAGDAAAAVRALAADRDRQGLMRDDLTAAGFSQGKAGKALAAAVAAGELEELPAEGGAGGGRWFRAGTLAALRAALLAGAAERAAARPERPFSGAAELATLVPALPASDTGRLLQSMVEAGELVAGEGGFAPAGAGVLGDEQAAVAEVLLARLAEDPFAPPTLAVLAEDMRRPPKELSQILDVLTRRGDVVRVDRDLWFATAAVDDARALLLAQLESAGEVTIAGFRDAAGCGRRNAQALLEYFDREGLTLRRGDVRVARRRR